MDTVETKGLGALCLWNTKPPKAQQVTILYDWYCLLQIWYKCHGNYETNRDHRRFAQILRDGVDTMDANVSYYHHCDASIGCRHRFHPLDEVRVLPRSLRRSNLRWIFYYFQKRPRHSREYAFFSPPSLTEKIRRRREGLGQCRAGNCVKRASQVPASRSTAARAGPIRDVQPVYLRIRSTSCPNNNYCSLSIRP